MAPGVEARFDAAAAATATATAAAATYPLEPAMPYISPQLHSCIPAAHCLRGTELRRLKAEYLKLRGDTTLMDGNIRDARAWYGAALAAVPPCSAAAALRRALRANRSLASLRGGRPAEALTDAAALTADHPHWAKGHYRAAQALLALKRHEEAVAALAAAACIEPGNPEVERLMEDAVGALTRPQLAGALLTLALEQPWPPPLMAPTRTPTVPTLLTPQVQPQAPPAPQSSPPVATAAAAAAGPSRHDAGGDDPAAAAAAGVVPGDVLDELREAAFLVVRDAEEGPQESGVLPPLADFRPRALYRRWASRPDGSASPAAPGQVVAVEARVSTPARTIAGSSSGRSSSRGSGGDSHSDWRHVESWLFLAAALLRSGHYGPAVSHAAAAAGELRRELSRLEGEQERGREVRNPPRPVAASPFSSSPSSRQQKPGPSTGPDEAERWSAEALLDALSWCCCAVGDAMLAKPLTPPKQPPPEPKLQDLVAPRNAVAADGSGRDARGGGAAGGGRVHDLAAAMACFRGALRLCPRSRVYTERLRSACARLDGEAAAPRQPRGAASTAVLRALGLMTDDGPESQAAAQHPEACEVESVLVFVAGTPASATAAPLPPAATPLPGPLPRAQPLAVSTAPPPPPPPPPSPSPSCCCKLAGPTRMAFRAAIARAAGVAPAAVMIERMRELPLQPSPSAPAGARAAAAGGSTGAAPPFPPAPPGLEVGLTLRVAAGAAAAAAPVSGGGAVGAEAVVQMLQDPAGPLARELQILVGGLMDGARSTTRLRAVSSKPAREGAPVLPGDAPSAGGAARRGSGKVVAVADGAKGRSAGEDELASEQDDRDAALECGCGIDVMPTASSGLLSLPFRLYRLVTAAGRPVERRRRHPFGLMRALYSAPDLPPSLVGDSAVWAEPLPGAQWGGGGFRWRQSAGEVHVLATRVPPGLPASELEVEVRPRSLRVANRTTGDVYLYGDLEAVVLADQTTWALGSGEAAAGGGGGSIGSAAGGAGGGGGSNAGDSRGGGGLTVTLVKMRPAEGAGSDGWWVRCLEGAPAVAWEEVSERDYSTMPPDRLEEVRWQQARMDEEARSARNAAAAAVGPGDGGGGSDGSGEGGP